MKKKTKILGQILFWVGYPGIYLLLRNSHRTRVIIYADEKVLFVRNWLGENKFSLPGGGVKAGEASKQAAIREVMEETGINLSDNSLKLIAENILLKENGIKYFADCYSVELPQTVKTYSKHLEIIESVWLPWRQKLDTNKLSKNTNQLLHVWMSLLHLVD